jgi:hypothetical protein
MGFPLGRLEYLIEAILQDGLVYRTGLAPARITSELTSGYDVR